MSAAALAQNTTRVQQLFQSAKTWQAEFKQESLGKDGHVQQTIHGKIAISRPGKFRWEVIKPFQQFIISNGKNVYFYDPDLKQVIVKSLPQTLSSTPAALLTGDTTAWQRFNVTRTKPDSALQTNLEWWTAKPKDSQQEAGIQEIALGLGTSELEQMRIKDALGQITVIRFTTIQRNATLPARTFQFEAPANVDVIDEAALQKK